MSKKNPKNPFNSLAKRQKLWVRMVLEGTDPKVATMKLYPCCSLPPGTLGFRNLDLRVSTIMRNEKIKTAINFMTAHQANPDVIKNNLMLILQDKKLKPSERLKAMAMLERMNRNSEPPEEPKRKQKQKPGEMYDEQLRAKLKDLEAKTLGPN